jgi:hypothetical protein
MSYYLVKFAKKGQRHSDTFEKIMFEAISVAGAQDRADVVAGSAGGGKAALQIFNEIGLVSTRSMEGLWSR